MTTKSEVIEFNPNKIQAFDEFESELAKLKEDNSKAVFDYRDPKGNKDARSHIYKLRQTKSAVDRARKEAKAKALEYGKAVDSKAKTITGEIEDMIAYHEEPLKEIEEKEAARVKGHKDRIQSLGGYKDIDPGSSSKTWESELAFLDQVADADYDYEEFQLEADEALQEAHAAVSKALADRLQFEKDQEELEQLRKEAAERRQKDMLDKIAREAREKAEKEAVDRAEREAAMREEEDKRAKAQLEQAKREAFEAQERAKRAEKEAKERAEKEHQEQLEAEKREAEKREADKKHRDKIFNGAVTALKKAGLDLNDATAAVTAIDEGNVPGVSLSY